MSRNPTHKAGGQSPSRRNADLAKIHIAKKQLGMDDDTYQMGKNAPRPCPARVWAEGIRQVLDRAESGGLTTPLKNHNYLRTITYELVDREDAKNETRREAQRIKKTRRDEQEPVELERAIPEEALADMSRLGLGSRGKGC